LVDEVLAVGDGLFQAKCLANFQHLKEQGKTIVLVTHNLDLITTRCSRALLIDGGMIVDDGASKSVVDRYNRLVLSGSRANRGLIRESAAGAFQTEASSKGLQWQGLFTINPNEDRYGPGTAEILEAGIFTPNDAPVQVLQRNRDYFIKVKVRHNDSMQAAVTAFSIKDLKGTILCGTNTSYQKIDMGWMDKGEVVVVTFKQFLRLNSGEFLLSLGCGAFHGGDYVVYDRRFDYLSFQVVGEEPRVGLFDPESTIEWSRAG
jgi:teichoic acid transport system ATP-binding protein